MHTLLGLFKLGVKRFQKLTTWQKLMYGYLVFILFYVGLSKGIIQQFFNDLLDALAIPIIIITTILWIRNDTKRRQNRKEAFGLYAVDEMNGYEFEHFLATLFRKLGYGASVTRGSGDFGADLILNKGFEKTVVQAKKYGTGRKVGPNAIQQAYTAKNMYNAKKAIVVTNQFYTKASKELARVNNVKLIDRNKLKELINGKGKPDMLGSILTFVRKPYR